jgi:hypothetical protein
MAVLIIAGLALFLLRAQLLRVAIGVVGADPARLHASARLGAASGWAALGGAGALVALAFAATGLVTGLLLLVAGIAAGLGLSALVIALVGQTLVAGHHGGEGPVSVAALNRRFGHWLAFGVAALAAIAWAPVIG